MSSSTVVKMANRLLIDNALSLILFLLCNYKVLLLAAQTRLQLRLKQGMLGTVKVCISIIYIPAL